MNLNEYGAPHIMKCDGAIAENEFGKYRIVQNRLFESDFDRVVKDLEGDE